MQLNTSPCLEVFVVTYYIETMFCKNKLEQCIVINMTGHICLLLTFLFTIAVTLAWNDGDNLKSIGLDICNYSA